MTEQNTFATTEPKQQAANDSRQVRRVIFREMENIRSNRNRLDMKPILQLIKQLDCEFSIDEDLDFIFSRSGLGRDREVAQLFTPSNIAELIFVISQIYAPKSVIDICCGTGNVLRYFKDLQTVKGMDINPEIIQLAQYINPNAVFSVVDTLEFHVDRDSQKSMCDEGIKYDLVIGDLPLGCRTIDRQPLELALIKKGLNLLNNNGVAIFVVPESLLTNRLSRELRAQLLSDFSLDMVISLPPGIFPNSSFNNKSILVVRNGNSKPDIFMPVYEDNATVIAENFKQHKGDFYLPISDITDRLDRNHYSSLEAISEILRGRELIKLSNVAEIIMGRPLHRSTFTNNGKYLLFKRENRDGNNYIDTVDERYILRSGDIVIPLVMPRQNNEVFIYKEADVETVITEFHAIIRPIKDKEYLKSYLQTEDWKILLQRHLKNSIMQRLDIGSLQDIEIPRLSDSELNDLILKTLKLNNEVKYYLQTSSDCVKDKQYDLARAYIEQAFKNTDAEESNHKDVYLANIDNIEELEIKDQKLEEKNKQLQASQIELEDMMSMFAHKFRSPLDAIIYNTTHENQVKLYTEAAQTMRGLLNIFSIISTDADILKDKIKQDYQGGGSLATVFSKTLDMILLHLLSVSGAEKIQQHYMAYAQRHGQCDENVIYKVWCEDYFELEQALQAEWEASYAQLLNQSNSLEQRLTWLEEHFFKLVIIGFERTDIQFKEYGTTESLLTILLNEILVNAFKYYSSTSKQAVVLEWVARDDYQVLICSNPSFRSERSIIKGSHKGHVFLSTLARKTGSLFSKPIPQDHFVLEFGIPNELLISN